MEKKKIIPGNIKKIFDKIPEITEEEEFVLLSLTMKEAERRMEELEGRILKHLIRKDVIKITDIPISYITFNRRPLTDLKRRGILFEPKPGEFMATEG